MYTLYSLQVNILPKNEVGYTFALFLNSVD